MNQRFKAKWSWGGTLANPGTDLETLYLLWDDSTQPYLGGLYDGTDHIQVNNAFSNQANQNMWNLFDCLKCFTQIIQYGLKFKMRIQNVNLDGGNVIWFTAWNRSSGLAYDAQTLGETPQVRKTYDATHGFINSAGVLINVERRETQIRRYFDLGKMGAKWKKDPTAYAGDISASGVPSDGAGGINPFVIIGCCSRNGAQFTMGATHFIVNIEVTNYYYCFGPRWPNTQ